MIAFLLLAPLIFLSTLASVFAAVTAMMAASFALVTGPLMAAVTIGSTALLGALMFLLS